MRYNRNLKPCGNMATEGEQIAIYLGILALVVAIIAFPVAWVISRYYYKKGSKEAKKGFEMIESQNNAIDRKQSDSNPSEIHVAKQDGKYIAPAERKRSLDPEITPITDEVKGEFGKGKGEPPGADMKA